MEENGDDNTISWEESKEIVSELDRRIEELKTGKVEWISWEEIKCKI